MSDSKSKLRKGMTKNEVSTSSSSSTCSWSSDDDNDTVVLKAIKDYLPNRTELAHQLFKSVKIEKIRMMLPQILKKIDIAELKELCASELCGMSKSRILSILNGMSMINSSGTSESDDSGPSLEIISDTEAWISDGEQQNCFLSSNRDKSRIQSKKSKLQTNHNGSTSSMSKCRRKARVCIRTESKLRINIKKEKEKEVVKTQGGESLLDLLELEMRARAIKALIRKEEDIVSTLECEQDTLNVDVPKELVNCSSSHESSSLLDARMDFVNIDGDQDVVMLINPTPTINLLSSDNESDDCNKCGSAQLEHEHQNDDSRNRDIECEQNIFNEKSPQPIMTTPDCKKSENDRDNLTKWSLIVKNIDDNCGLPMKVDTKYVSDGYNEFQMKTRNPSTLCLDHKIMKVEDKQDKEFILISENKLVDEEIIELDDYPADMDDIENYEYILSRNEGKLINKNNIADHGYEKSENIMSNSAETWATRYYQTDSVQNVIKESKIQSEIRKRLRERQKLSKLNTSSKSVQISCIEDNNKQMGRVHDELSLTGSVQEYLALEGTNNVNRVDIQLKQIAEAS